MRQEVLFIPTEIGAVGSAHWSVGSIAPRIAKEIVVAHHYMHREPPISYAFGLFIELALMGVCTVGVPASHCLRVSASRETPERVFELNRLWVDDQMPRNSESWFVARVLRALPPMILVSYADTAQGHLGFIYRALNFRYAGWTDMDRKTPRFDYVPHNPAQHSREASRMRGPIQSLETRRRKPKVKYWTVTGNARDAAALNRACNWPSLDWRTLPPPGAAL